MATPQFDLATATEAMAAVVAGIDTGDLGAATPCPDMTVRDLLFHALGFTEAFRQGATKEGVGHSVPPQPAPRTDLPDGWAALLAAQLTALAEAWRDPAAWDGETEVGGVTAPAAGIAGFALDEVVVHGWDLARATGQDYHFADDDVAVLLEQFRETPPEGVPGLFGPVVAVAAGAPDWQRLIGLTGRDPGWRR